MKKALLGVGIIAVGAIIGSSYYIGLQAEQVYKQQLSALETQAPLSGIKVESAHFERGLFTSNSQLHLLINNYDDKPIEITADSHLRHGPILWSDSTIKLGLFSTSDTITLTQGPQEAIQFIDQHMNGHLATASSYVDFQQQTTVNAQIPSFEATKDGTTVSFGGIKLQLAGDLLLQSAKGQVDIAQFSIKDAQGALDIAPSQGRINYRQYQQQITLGDADLNLPQIQINSPQFKLSLQNLALSVKQEIDQGKINFSEQLSVQEINAPFPVTAAAYRLDLKRINPDAITLWSEIMAQINQAPAGTTNLDNLLTVQQQRELISALLQKGLQLNQQLKVSAFGGQLLADLDIEYLGLPNNLHPLDVQDPSQFLQAIKGLLSLSADENAVMASPLAQAVPAYLQQGLLTRKNGKLVAKATLIQGQLMVNGTQIPLEQLLQPNSPANNPHTPQAQLPQPQQPQTPPSLTVPNQP